MSGTGQLGVTSCDAEKKKEFVQLDIEGVRELLLSIPVRKYKYKEGWQGQQVGTNIQDLERAGLDELFPDFIVRNEGGKGTNIATQFLPWLMLRLLQDQQREIDILKGAMTDYSPNYSTEY